MDLASRPAFARPVSAVSISIVDAQDGMTLLEYFAGQSLAGYRSTQLAYDAQPDDVARWAVADAKALCAALQKAKPVK